MKRMLTITLTLIMLLAALTGCAESRNPSGNNEEQNPDGKRLTITLTIAETLPSCVSFEYKDGAPYYFYAYDTEGHLYRVLWNDFTGLNEKDVVVVDHNDVIKKLDDINPPGGWTPKYEITAIDVYPSEEPTGYEVEVKLLRYMWDGWGISAKTVGACDVAYNIIDALKAMKETGETVPKFSDDELEISGGQYPVERGTIWIECSGKIYRLTPDFSQICLVETHFGEGKVLEITDEFKTNVNNAWYYAPYDYYKGTYNKGDHTVELTNVFKSESSIQLNIKKIYVESKVNPQNTITVELVSDADKEVTIYLHCQQSDDNLAAGDYQTVRLEKGVPATVDLTFGGWPNFTYWVYIKADFTKAEITINP